MADEKGYWSEKVKHLEMIQGVIARLSGNCATMKRYCIAIVGAGFALEKTMPGAQHAIFALPLFIFIFWAMDGKYLQQEKWYRALFDTARAASADIPPDFRMKPESAERDASWLATAVSWSTWPVYVALFVLIVVLVVAR